MQHNETHFDYAVFLMFSLCLTFWRGRRNKGGYIVIKQFKGFTGISLHQGQGHKPNSWTFTISDLTDVNGSRHIDYQLMLPHWQGIPMGSFCQAQWCRVRFTKKQNVKYLSRFTRNYIKAESAFQSCLSWPFHWALGFCSAEVRGSYSFSEWVVVILLSKLLPKGLFKSRMTTTLPSP